MSPPENRAQKDSARLSLSKSLRELSVLLPAYGMLDTEWRLSRGDVPLFLQSPNDDRSSNLEKIAEQERVLFPSERLLLREREHTIRKGVFLAYQTLTSAYVAHTVLNLFR